MCLEDIRGVSIKKLTVCRLSQPKSKKLQLCKVGGRKGYGSMSDLLSFSNYIHTLSTSYERCRLPLVYIIRPSRSQFPTQKLRLPLNSDSQAHPLQSLSNSQSQDSYPTSRILQHHLLPKTLRKSFRYGFHIHYGLLSPHADYNQA